MQKGLLGKNGIIKTRHRARFPSNRPTTMKSLTRDSGACSQALPSSSPFPAPSGQRLTGRLCPQTSP